MMWTAVVLGLFLSLIAATAWSLCVAAATPRPTPPVDVDAEWLALDHAVNGRHS